MRTIKTFSRKDHLLDIEDHDKDEILSIIKLIGRLKEAAYHGIQLPLFQDKTVGLLFNRPSLRTRVSFETAAFQMGGHAQYIDLASTHFGHGNESMRDTAEVLSRMVDAIVIRWSESADVDEFAKHSLCPVIDGCTFDRHPTQVICDVFTMIEHRPELAIEDMKVMFISDCNHEFQRCCMVQRSLMRICAILGITFIACAPKVMQPCLMDVEVFQRLAENTGAKMLITDDPHEYIADADFLVSEIITRKGAGVRRGMTDEEFNSIRMKLLYPKYQINEQLLKEAKTNVGVMHCMPGNRDEEITSEVWDGPNSLLFEEAENRLHTQKALLAWFVRQREASIVLQDHHKGVIEDFLFKWDLRSTGKTYPEKEHEFTLRDLG